MENKINLAAILKDCPRGMELDCSIHTRPVIFNCVKMESDYPIRISSKDGFSHSLTYWGSLYNCKDAKCVIFPKGKTTWEGFQIPFKDGDVVATNSGAWIGITTGGEKGELMPTYCVIQSDDTFEAYLGLKNKWYFDRLATEEEKERLFRAIKDNGYKWNVDTKTLEKLIKPEFKAGDKIRSKNKKDECFYILNVDKDRNKYILNIKGYCLEFKDQNNYELVPNKFNISTLKPFDSRVLVRDDNSNRWKVSFWGCLVDSEYGFKYDTIRGRYKQCIPYEGNEHLLGKTDDCIDFYKTW